MSSDPREAAIERVVRYMQTRPGRTAASIRHNLSRHKVLASDVQAAAERCGYHFTPSPPPGPRPPQDPVTPVDLGGGIALTGQNLMSHKPADSAKVHLLRLPKGQAFILTDLAAKVGVSVETLKRHAKDLKCLLYLEVTPGDWRQVVLNPETAKQYVP